MDSRTQTLIQLAYGYFMISKSPIHVHTIHLNSRYIFFNMQIHVWLFKNDMKINVDLREACCQGEKISVLQ